MKIYIAGSFSTPEERKSLEDMIKYVRTTRANDELFIPMEHFIPNAWDLKNSDWGREVYKMDKVALDNCDEMFACYNGRYSGTGTAFEIGYFAAQNKPINLYVPDHVDMTSVMVMNAACNIIYPGTRFVVPEQK